jgi:dTDP-4-dehydrorhamnose 3,5-epimerase
MIENGKIEGVKIKNLKVFKDNPDLKQDVEPGIFIEVLRESDDLLKHFSQSNFALDQQGSIKAFHYHKYQDDLWFFATGKVVIVLYDQRKDSPSFGATEAITAGKDDYKLVLIPIGVAHGYKVISKEPSMLFYHVTNEYNRETPDEERIDPYDKEINFDWNKI